MKQQFEISSTKTPQARQLLAFTCPNGAQQKVRDDRPASQQSGSVLLDQDLVVNTSYSGIIQIGAPGELEFLQTQLLTMPSDGYFYTFLTNYSDTQVSFDNLTIHHKQGVLRTQYDYYPYGLVWGRSLTPNPNKGYNETYAGSEFNYHEWGDVGLDLNYFEARYYDPVLGRFHAPDPYEQFHSPYMANFDDPANHIDPDGRASKNREWNLQCITGAATELGFLAWVVFGGNSGVGQAVEAVAALANLAGAISTVASLSGGGMAQLTQSPTVPDASAQQHAAMQPPPPSLSSQNNDTGHNAASDEYSLSPGGKGNGMGEPIDAKKTTPSRNTDGWNYPELRYNYKNKSFEEHYTVNIRVTNPDNAYFSKVPFEYWANELSERVEMIFSHHRTGSIIDPDFVLEVNITKDGTNDFMMYVDSPIYNPMTKDYTLGRAKTNSPKKNNIFLSVTFEGKNRPFSRQSQTLAHELGHTAGLHHIWLDENKTKPGPFNFNTWTKKNLMNSGANPDAATRYAKGRELELWQLDIVSKIVKNANR